MSGQQGLIASAAKRLLDIFVAFLLLTLLSPFLLCSAVAILFSMGRPILFRQLRPGLHGKPFMLLKLRTMVHVHHQGATIEDADRLTGLGRLLRQTSLDELPQLWNVLSGDMSLVGPRPLLMDYMRLYDSEQARRHSVRPGLTGWAQINGRNNISWKEKFELDLWYVDHRSFQLDAKILLITVSKVLRREGISQAGHATSERFLGN